MRKICTFALYFVCAIVFAQSQKVTVFLVNPKLYPNNDNCDKVAASIRTISATPAVANAALVELFRGLTDSEKSAGFESLFSSDTSQILKKINVRSGIAYVNLTDNVRTSLGNATSSCGRATFFAQIERTLKQFKTVKSIYYAIDDEPKAFFEWMEFDMARCKKTAHRCSAQPFK